MRKGRKEPQPRRWKWSDLGVGVSFGLVQRTVPAPPPWVWGILWGVAAVLLAASARTGGRRGLLETGGMLIGGWLSVVIGSYPAWGSLVSVLLAFSVGFDTHRRFGSVDPVYQRLRRFRAFRRAQRYAMPLRRREAFVLREDA